MWRGLGCGGAGGVGGWWLRLGRGGSGRGEVSFDGCLLKGL